MWHGRLAHANPFSSSTGEAPVPHRRRSAPLLRSIALIIIAISTALLAAEPSTQPMMSAIVIHEHGGPEVLKLEQIPRPTPGEGELLVRVHAAGVNPVDWKMRAAGFGGRGKLPYT